MVRAMNSVMPGVAAVFMGTASGRETPFHAASLSFGFKFSSFASAHAKLHAQPHHSGFFATIKRYQDGCAHKWVESLLLSPHEDVVVVQQLPSPSSSNGFTEYHIPSVARRLAESTRGQSLVIPASSILSHEIPIAVALWNGLMETLEQNADVAQFRAASILLPGNIRLESGSFDEVYNRRVTRMVIGDGSVALQTRVLQAYWRERFLGVTDPHVDSATEIQVIARNLPVDLLEWGHRKLRHFFHVAKQVLQMDEALQEGGVVSNADRKQLEVLLKLVKALQARELNAFDAWKWVALNRYPREKRVHASFGSIGLLSSDFLRNKMGLVTSPLIQGIADLQANQKLLDYRRILEKEAQFRVHDALRAGAALAADQFALKEMDAHQVSITPLVDESFRGVDIFMPQHDETLNRYVALAVLHTLTFAVFNGNGRIAPKQRRFFLHPVLLKSGDLEVTIEMPDVTFLPWSIDREHLGPIYTHFEKLRWPFGIRTSEGAGLALRFFVPPDTLAGAPDVRPFYKREWEARKVILERLASGQFTILHMLWL